MISKSIRISAEHFEHAQRRGELLSRSAAQQLEHWARLSVALEQCGLSLGELVELLRGGQATHKLPENNLWATKRAQQARDIAAIESGKASNESMSWFSGGRARRAKAIKSPLWPWAGKDCGVDVAASGTHIVTLVPEDYCRVEALRSRVVQVLCCRPIPVARDQRPNINIRLLLVASPDIHERTLAASRRHWRQAASR